MQQLIRSMEQPACATK